MKFCFEKYIEKGVEKLMYKVKGYRVVHVWRTLAWFMKEKLLLWESVKAY